MGLSRFCDVRRATEAERATGDIGQPVMCDAACRKVGKETILDEAAVLTSGPRQESYGHPIEDHTRTAKMWSAVLGVEVTAEQVCLCMVCLKISRQCYLPKLDNLIDACGYLRNVEMIQEKLAERKVAGGYDPSTRGDPP